MSIQVKLYGDLRERSKQGINHTGAPSSMNVELNGLKTVFDIMNKFDIKESEISHIFVNGKYCGPGKAIKDGDRVGIFPKKMGIMFVEITKNNTISLTVKLFATLRKYGPAKAVFDLPEGSTIKSIITKYGIPKEENLKIMVNGRPHKTYDFILNDNDVVAIFPPLAGG